MIAILFCLYNEIVEWNDCNKFPARLFEEVGE